MRLPPAARREASTHKRAPPRREAWLALFLRDPPLSRAHELGGRPPLRLLLAGTATVLRIGHVLATLASLAHPAGDASLGVLARGPLSPTPGPPRRRLAATPRPPRSVL